MKRYEVKIYSLWNPSVPKKTLTFISWNKEAVKLKNDFKFDGNANNWQWPLRLEFNKLFNDQDVALGDIVRVRGYDDEHKTGRGIYSGYVDNLKRRADQEGQSIELTMFWLATLMNTIIAGGGIFSYPNTDPSIIITAALDDFNSNFVSPLITFDPLPLYGSPIDFRLDDATTLDVIKAIHNVTWWIFYVDWDGVFTTQPKGTIPDHKFTLKKDLNVVEKNSNRSDIVTRVYYQVTNVVAGFAFDWNGNVVPITREIPITYIYDNLAAQAIFGIIERRVIRDDLYVEEWVVTPAVDNAANTYLEENSKPKNFLRLEINDKADFLTIKPWDLVRIQNLDFTLEDAIINKINYSSTVMAIDCEKTLDFWQEVVNNP